MPGSLRVGSRTPVADAPPWVTLEVVHGGFATGRFAAGGPLQPHEAEKLRQAPLDQSRVANFRAELLKRTRETRLFHDLFDLAGALTLDAGSSAILPANLRVVPADPVTATLEALVVLEE